MNLIEALLFYQDIVEDEGKEVADRWLYDHYSSTEALRSQSPLDLIAASVNSQGQFIATDNTTFDLVEIIVE